MASAYIGQIEIFGGNFAPRAWTDCSGQLLAIAQHQALFSLLGTIYGGDGRTTFALPDLRGRSPIHEGTGPGLSERRLGVKGGAETVTLTTSHLPSHSHPVAMPASDLEMDTDRPDGNVPARGGAYASAQEGSKTLGSSTSGNTGGSSPVSNVSPFLAINYSIALQGIYPSRS